MDLHAHNLSIANNWIMSTPSLSRMFTDIGRLITSLIPSISHASTFTTRIPLNLSWNQFINYHIIKFKYKYYMVSYYVFGITVNSTAYCIIQLAAHSMHARSLARSPIYTDAKLILRVQMVSMQQHFKWQIMRFIINEPWKWSIEIYSNFTRRTHWTHCFQFAKNDCDTLFIHSNTFHMDGH